MLPQEKAVTPSPTGVFAKLRHSWRASIDMVAQTLDLAVLEARLACYSLLAMLGLGILACFILLCAWGFLNAFVIIMCLSSGYSLSSILLSLMAFHLLLLVPIVLSIRRFARHLKFTALRRQLKN